MNPQSLNRWPSEPRVSQRNTSYVLMNARQAGVHVQQPTHKPPQNARPAGPAVKRVAIILTFLFLLANVAFGESPLAPIPRRIPPQGIEIPTPIKTELLTKHTKLSQQLASLKKHPLAADAEILLKAVRFAISNGEFYHAKEFARATAILDLAEKRIEALRQNKPAWPTARGLVVRGYQSSIDRSAQPYGLVVPEQLDLSKPVPLYVWLHGRGDKTTDLHFIHQRLTSAGKINVSDAIIIHPFGRQCMGFKSAGEIDVLDAIAHVQTQYKIDPQRIALMGFSMGGAGCWHLGAHYADRWVVMSPGAGFAETALYNRLAKEDYPPWYEQKLWGLYDVPCYTRNLFNLPVVAYSGEVDKQIQAARVMEAALVREGKELTHIIGPGMGHKYHTDSLSQILARVKAARDKGLNVRPERVFLQTRTLRYHKLHWVDVQGLEEHWVDSRVDATRTPGKGVTVVTKNIARLRLAGLEDHRAHLINIDGQEFPLSSQQKTAVHLQKVAGRWQIQDVDTEGFAKRPGLQGPIDDVFMAPFLVVVADKKSSNALFQRWVDFEFAYLTKRWRELYRGDLPVRSASELTEADIKNHHLILWGDRESNRWIDKIAPKLPIKWTDKHVVVGKKTFDVATHAPAFIYPNPLNPYKYVVINSGVTFRSGHDRTNSLQNPKIPDWSILDLRQAPTNLSAGRVVVADFFDEQWQLKPQRQSSERNLP